MAASVAIGMVIGAGLFKSPALVAANVGSLGELLGVWLLGGVLGVLGGLCYAELAAAFPSQGGDYRFLKLAYGPRVGFLFAWARFAVINTGSLALLGFVFGDYLNAWLPAGPHGPSIYAVAILLLFTAINLRGRTWGIDAQLGLTNALILGVALLGMVGLWFVVHATAPLDPQPAAASSVRGFGVALVFVMLAYGGWSEIATLSAELEDPQRGILRALMLAMTVVTVLYLIINWSLWRGLGLTGLTESAAPATDLLRRAFGGISDVPVILVVYAAIVTSINATIIVGARTTLAGARDWPGLTAMAEWDEAQGVPHVAIIAQSAVALALVGLGTITRKGFETMVDYTAPVYWLFMTLSALAVIVLRRRLPDAPRPFRTPLYPLLPLLFAAASGFVLWSSISYVRIGALVGVAVLGVGLVLTYALRTPADEADH
jgi:amino acid transporter